jgi:Zn ribbon nucleic-acid-binding protein
MVVVARDGEVDLVFCRSCGHLADQEEEKEERD